MSANLFGISLMEIYPRWTRSASLMVVLCQNPFQCNLDLMNILLIFNLTFLRLIACTVLKGMSL